MVVNFPFEVNAVFHKFMIFDYISLPLNNEIALISYMNYFKRNISTHNRNARGFSWKYFKKQRNAGLFL